ncbi:hypothetical protein AB0M87_17035 [Streptomyces sp. NPDC051320]|uniref:hypothetical protein n=1 Tax=Streptomyces sp. NPDC051320 TaxID=3154644 RepID=UPI00341EA08A
MPVPAVAVGLALAAAGLAGAAFSALAAADLEGDDPPPLLLEHPLTATAQRPATTHAAAVLVSFLIKSSSGNGCLGQHGPPERGRLIHSTAGARNGPLGRPIRGVRTA